MAPHFKLPPADIHARAEEYFTQLDRAHFEAHLDVSSYTRPPVDHEWCCPACREETGECVSLVGTVVVVEVTSILPGVRVRHPLVLGDPPCPHHAEVPVWADAPHPRQG